MSDITWSLPATLDLDRIAGWLDEHRGVEISARTLEEIGRRTDFLRNFPHAGRPYKADKRILVVFGTPYVIVYRLSGRDAEIVRVHHKREDWQVAI